MHPSKPVTPAQRELDTPIARLQQAVATFSSRSHTIPQILAMVQRIQGALSRNLNLHPSGLYFHPNTLVSTLPQPDIRQPSEDSCLVDRQHNDATLAHPHGKRVA